MSNIDDKINDINNTLKQDELIKKYNYLANQIANDCSINELNNKLEELNKKLCKEIRDSLNDSKDKILTQIELIKNELNTNPLYQQYNTYKEEVTNLINDINDILNQI